MTKEQKTIVRGLKILFCHAANDYDAVVAASVVLNPQKSSSWLNGTSLAKESRDGLSFYVAETDHMEARKVLADLEGEFSDQVTVTHDGSIAIAEVNVPAVLEHAGLNSTAHEP